MTIIYNSDSGVLRWCVCGWCIPDDPSAMLAEGEVTDWDGWVERREKFLQVWDALKAVKAISSILEKIETEARQNTDAPWFFEAITISKDNPSCLSYSYLLRDVFNDNKRQKASWAKALRAWAKRGIVDVAEGEIQMIAREAGKINKADFYEFEVLSGDGLKAVYRDGPRSCMSGAENGDKVSLWAENPEKVNVVAIRKDGTLVGRALVFNTDQGVRFLDRVYPVDGGPHVAAVKEWARRQGWDVRYSQEAIDHETEKHAEYSVTLRAPSNNLYPYADTFVYGYFKRNGNLIVLTNYQHDEVRCMLTRTDGDYGDVYRCEQCGDLIFDGNVYYVNDITYCDNCYFNNFTVCCVCDKDILIAHACMRDGESYCELCYQDEYQDECQNEE